MKRGPVYRDARRRARGTFILPGAVLEKRARGEDREYHRGFIDTRRAAIYYVTGSESDTFGCS